MLSHAQAVRGAHTIGVSGDQAERIALRYAQLTRTTMKNENPMKKDTSYVDLRIPAPMIDGPLRADWSIDAWVITHVEFPGWSRRLTDRALARRYMKWAATHPSEFRAVNGLSLQENPIERPGLVLAGLAGLAAIGAAIYFATRQHGPPGGGATPIATVTRTIENNGQTVTLSLKRDVMNVVLPVASGTGYRWVLTETVSPPPVAIRSLDSIGTSTPGAPIGMRWEVTPATLGNGTLQWALVKPDGSLSGDSFVLNVIVAE